MFLNPFWDLSDSNGFEVPFKFQKFLLALKIKQSFILFIYFHISRFGKSWDVTRVMHTSLVTILLEEPVLFIHNKIICRSCYINPSRLKIAMKDQILS